MAITILEGSTFCICDERGDIAGDTGGFFADDTRFLSLLRLTVDGEKPLLLSFGKVEYFSAAFYLRNPLTGGLPQDSVSIIRERFIGEAMQDRIVVQNQAMRSRSRSSSRSSWASDFADIFAVKDHDFALGDPARASRCRRPSSRATTTSNNQFVLEDDERARQRRSATQVILSQRGEVEGGKVAYRLELEPRERWDLRVDILALAGR